MVSISNIGRVLVLCLLLAGCASTKQEAEAPKIPKTTAVSYAQIISALPSWDRTVLDRVTDEQILICFFCGCALCGSIIFGCKETLGLFCKEPPPVPPTTLASTAEYAYVQQMAEKYAENADFDQFLAKMDQHTLTKGDVARVGGIVESLE